MLTELVRRMLRLLIENLRWVTHFILAAAEQTHYGAWIS
jgi:hypothetical protein